MLKCLILGHSFVRNLKIFIGSNLPQYNYTLKLNQKEIMIQFSSKPSPTVESLKACQLADIEYFEPELVILDIGTNELCHATYEPSKLASAILSLVDILIPCCMCFPQEESVEVRNHKALRVDNSLDNIVYGQDTAILAVSISPAWATMAHQHHIWTRS